MRKHMLIVAALAAALFTGACTPPDDAAPDCTAKPKPAACSTAKPAQPKVTDIDTVVKYLKSTRDYLDVEFEIVTVKNNKTYTCSDKTEVKGSTQDIVVCDDNKKVVVPEDIEYAWGSYEPPYIAYQVILPAIKTSPKVFPTAKSRACAAAFIAAHQDDVTPKKAGDLDRPLMKHLKGDDTRQAASTGVHLALNDGNVTLCARQ